LLAFYLKNKFAQIIVLLFREDFPHRWPAFFDDLIAAVANDQTGMMTEMFLRIMLAIDEEVVSIEINRTTEEIQKNSVLVRFLLSVSLPNSVVEHVFVVARRTPNLFSFFLCRKIKFVNEQLGKLWICGITS